MHGSASRFGSKRAALLRWVAVQAAAAMLGVALAGGEAVPAGEPRTRVGFSRRMFTGLNENDVRAALRSWFQTLMQERPEVRMDPEPMVLDGVGQVVEALRSGALEAVELTAREYVEVSRRCRLGELFAGATRGVYEEQFVLVARKADAAFPPGRKPEGRLIVYDHYRADLAWPWLEIWHREHGLPRPATGYGRVDRSGRLAQVVLPVFFGQADACLVTREGFELMGELNPQVRQRLRIVAESPRVVPAVLCFWPESPAALKEPLIEAVRELADSEAGRQLLWVFRRDALEEVDPEAMAGTVALVEAWERLQGTGDGSPSAGADAKAGRP
ncbi:MAG: hypothetical protein D6766_09905 [Verrucomicrobia bacterium]|nr:MAG: hypothetical protein D6766_09905 [Verrucomicrobiota bacterium]